MLTKKEKLLNRLQDLKEDLEDGKYLSTLSEIDSILEDAEALPESGEEEEVTVDQLDTKENEDEENTEDDSNMYSMEEQDYSSDELFKKITDKMVATYIAKNHDYGNSFSKSLDTFGLISAIIRLTDKLNRVEALSKSDAKVQDESMLDTLLDMANYAIMTYIWLVNKK